MSFSEHKKILQALNQFNSELNNMVVDMGNIAYNQTMESFRNQGYTDETLVKWKQRKRSERGRGVRGVLIGQATGTSGLRASYRKLRRSKLSISIINNKVYSGVHNEGLKAGRGKGFKMPERRMIGDSAIMRRKIESKLNQRIRKIWPS